MSVAVVKKFRLGGLAISHLPPECRFADLAVWMIHILGKNELGIESVCV